MVPIRRVTVKSQFKVVAIEKHILSKNISLLLELEDLIPINSPTRIRVNYITDLKTADKFQLDQSYTMTIETTHHIVNGKIMKRSRVVEFDSNRVYEVETI